MIENRFQGHTNVPELVNVTSPSHSQGSAEGALSGMNADAPQQIPAVIGEKEVQEAYQIYIEYKSGKKNLDERLVSNDQWYRGRHWEQMRDKKEEVEPTSSWLFNTIANKHADAMDNFPSPNILPREEADKGEAQKLSSIIPVILEQNNFEETYSEVSDNKVKSGTGIYGVFWNGEKHGGLGDIEITNIEPLNVAWRPGVTDIQKSPHFFHVGIEEHDVLKSMYPQLENKLPSTIDKDAVQYMFDDYVNTSKMAPVFDWYYKKKMPTGNGGTHTVVHYCKFCGDTVLYASENDPIYATRGYYDHGRYPFEFDVLYPIKGSPAGIGHIDVGKDAQAYIDRGDQILQRNMLSSGKPRYVYKKDGGIDVNDLADTTKDFIPSEGTIDDTAIRPLETKPLPTSFIEINNRKIEELKEVTGNRDISTGGTTSGVTAASAIAAMQEAGSKLSRDSNRSSYRAFKRVCYLVIELIRQFYSVPRTFRILGENGAEQFVTYSNANIQLQPQGVPFGTDMGLRNPEFDIEVSAQKSSPYSKMSQNEMALQFYSAGFFAPENTTQALACLEMMDFDRKQFIVNRISQNGTLYQQNLMLQKQCLMLAQMVDAAKGTNISEQIAAQIMGTPVPSLVSGAVNAEKTENLGGENMGEASVTKNARERVAESTAPA